MRKKLKKNRSKKKKFKKTKIRTYKKRKKLKNTKKKSKKINKSRKSKPKKQIIAIKKIPTQSLASRLVRFQLSLKSKFDFKINLSLEKYIQRFFDKIAETISDYQVLKQDEKRRIRLEQIEKERLERINLEKQKKQEEIEKTK